MRETAAEVQRPLEPFFNKQNNGGDYHAKGTLALAMHAGLHGVDDPVTLDRVRRWIDTLVKEVAIPGADHFGEAYVYEDLDGDGDREHDNRVAIPHVWEATLVLAHGGLQPGPPPARGSGRGGAGRRGLLPGRRRGRLAGAGRPDPSAPPPAPPPS